MNLNALKALVEKATALLRKLDQVEKDTAGMFAMAHIHGQNYKGANWGKEYKELEAALAASESKVCAKCETPMEYATGIGYYCPNQEVPMTRPDPRDTTRPGAAPSRSETSAGWDARAWAENWTWKETGPLHELLERAYAAGQAAPATQLAAWMVVHSFATGHGNSFEDLLKELEWQIAELHQPAETKKAT